jgi:predicted branched-subunit amino acid permease
MRGMDSSTGAGFRTAFREGAVDVLPVAIGIIPFGLVAGAAAVEAGLGVEGGLGLSVIVFAGASQLAAIDLLAGGAPAVVIVLTVAIINLRTAMYSAAVAPVLAPHPRSRRMGAAYLLVDQVFAMLVDRDARDDTAWNRLGYYMGLGTTLWVLWQVDTVVGAVVGASIPDWLPLSAAPPLVFLAILVPAITGRATLAAALVGGTVATVGVDLPYNLGLLAGALSGIAVGTGVALRVEVAAMRRPATGHSVPLVDTEPPPDGRGGDGGAGPATHPPDAAGEPGSGPTRDGSVGTDGPDQRGGGWA